jgi:LacI family transcriptional regulator
MENVASVATLKDVARVSGFSISTVSRALTGIGSVDPRTKSLIESVARDLGYRPHVGARMLVTRRSHVVGVIVATLEPPRRVSHPFLRELLDALKYSAGEGRYDLLLIAGHPEESAEHYVHRALSRRVDGLVLIGVDRSEIDRGGAEVRELASVGVPTVSFDLDIRSFGPWFGYVTSDNEAGARLAVRHLIELGRRRIACCAGPLDTPAGAERLDGYRAELDSAELPYRDEYVAVGDFSEREGARVTHRFLSLREPPDAVFACGDLMAIGAMRVLAEAGLRVPDDVAVVGFDDVEAASIVSPALTTVRQDKDELARAAVAMVGEMLQDPASAPRHRVVPVDLVVRGSSSQGATSKDALIKALPRSRTNR